jgi:1,2-diacylglycerol 3-beta-glucosyltransferase
MSSINKIKNAPPEVFRDRFLLVSIIISVWAFFKLLESILPDRVLDFLPGPLPLAMLFVIVLMMATYSVIIYFAQKWKAPHKELEEAHTFLEREIWPSVDIFIAAHNESAVIVDTVNDILKIEYPNYKIWVIDDRSIDKTSALVRELISNENLQGKVNLIQRLDGQTPGKAASLNQALSESSADLVLVFDADARIEKNCLKQVAHYFDDPKVGAVQFQKKMLNASFNTLTLCQDLEFALDTYLQLGRDSVKGSVELRGNGQVTSRKCMLQIGGWDERTLTEDLELSTRIHSYGWTIRFAPEIIVQEEAVITPAALFKQRRRWAEGSLRRYLTHFYSFISPNGKMTLVKRLDILPFLTQFAVPIWVFLDLVVEAFHFATNQPTHVTTLMLAFVLTSLNMWINISIGIRRWRNYKFIPSIFYGGLAFTYGALHWPPIVLWTIRKVIFGRRPTQWNKTPRMLDAKAEAGIPPSPL